MFVDGPKWSRSRSITHSALQNRTRLGALQLSCVSASVYSSPRVFRWHWGRLVEVIGHRHGGLFSHNPTFHRDTDTVQTRDHPSSNTAYQHSGPWSFFSVTIYSTYPDSRMVPRGIATTDSPAGLRATMLPRNPKTLVCRRRLSLAVHGSFAGISVSISLATGVLRSRFEWAE